jgi:N-acetyl-gamma-glutamyl-phosphate reductase
VQVPSYIASVAGSRAGHLARLLPDRCRLAVAPLLKNGLARLDRIVIGKSVSPRRSGPQIDPMYLYAGANENLQAYGLASHRHTPEIGRAIRAGRQRCA